ncbi:MAG TPA: hypothetical protein VFN67_18845 [Polyangiales bacterium]|nr:hypothetical protein [Polyangiales bacterium]
MTGLLFVDACSDEQEERCIPGRQLVCDCSTPGDIGARRCGSDGRYGECDCVDYDDSFIDPPEKPDRPRKRFEKPVDASMPTAEQPTTKVWSSANFELVNVFAHRAGIIVVSTDEIFLVDRTGMELGRITSPGRLYLTSLADDVLAVMDDNVLKFWQVGPKFVLLALVDLEEMPKAMVMLSGEQLVVMVNDELRTYAARTGKLIAKTSDSSAGNAFQRVPESARFLSLAGGRYLLNEVGADHITHVIARTEELFRSGGPIEFYGMPASHFITDIGAMISLQARECSPPAAADQPRCLYLDGALGLGTHDALASSANQLFDVHRLDSGLATLRSIDVNARKVLKERLLRPLGYPPVVLRFDTDSGRALLGYSDRSPNHVELIDP